jgi:hypothetical protein
MTYDALFDAMIRMEPVDMVFGLKKETTDNVAETGWTATAGSATNTQYVGKAAITNLELNAPNGEYATFTVQFTGVGALTPKKA